MQQAHGDMQRKLQELRTTGEKTEGREQAI